MKTNPMDLALLSRVRKTSIILGLVMSPIVAWYWGLEPGGAWLAGIAWSLVNLFFLGTLIKHVVTTEDRETAKLIGIVVVKFPVLYAIGFLLLRVEWLPVAGLVAGFAWPFFVLVMKGAGRFYLKMDEKPEASQT